MTRDQPFGADHGSGDIGPTLRVLSLGAGKQSTALLLLSAQGILPRLDAAIFADTGWEPGVVYEHLERIEREIARPAGIPIYRVSSGNIRADALDPAHRFASMPLYVLNQDGTPGMTRRQCTSEYKLKPIKRQVRDLLGYPHPTRVPDGVYVEQWIGISTDERDRAIDKDTGELKTGDVRYSRNRYPLLDLGLSRDACTIALTRAGFAATPKSACTGCPFHTNAQWRDLRDNHPTEFADAVAFDTAIRGGAARANADGNPLLGQAYLHRSRLPLGQAPIDRVTFREWATRQGDLLHELALAEFEESLPAEATEQLGGCSPFACHGAAVTDPEEAQSTLVVAP
ncbi:MAG: hypothetical protein L0H96_26035 [Humibacillus sp.]|nr:hypothetical protein [Humibacillus sp.]MDN5780335.1 hypothetical protein [Humibacillus sp.]